MTPEQEQASEKALWDWYMEWSTIARTVIDNRRLLHDLGFLEPHYAADTAETVAAPTHGASADGQSAQPSTGNGAPN